MNTQEGEILYRAIWGLYDELIGSIEYIFIINGCRVQDHAFRDIAVKYGIKTLYFELANIPGKTFVDPKGTNAKSALYKNKNILNQYNVLEEDYVFWKNAILRQNWMKKQ